MASHARNGWSSFPVTGQQLINTFLTTHCTLGAQFGARIGLDAAACTAIGQAYEQWDGAGQPHRLRGEQISLPARLVQFAGPVEVFVQRRGLESALAMARRRAGAEFDPFLVDLFCGHATEVLTGWTRPPGGR